MLLRAITLDLVEKAPFGFATAAPMLMEASNGRNEQAND